jgi:hypothetical protein
MPCDTRLKQGETPVQRKEVVKKAIGRLEAALTQGRVKVKVGANGAIAFEGWKPGERDDVSDVCAYRTLTAANSWALRQAVAKGEALAGRKVSSAAVNAGTHSHDGGITWAKGHK